MAAILSLYIYHYIRHIRIYVAVSPGAKDAKADNYNIIT
jgi:hypothetical protein